ncbi:olfactory receptor 6B2-like [Mantella aurantiaca]
MVNPENCTAVTEILLVGFKPFQGFRILIFVLFLIIYLLICGENLLIVFIIWSSARLKAPMFFIVQSMCVCDLVGISNFTPKFINDVICDQPVVKVTGCIVQLQVYGTYGDIGAFHFALMSYDRYLAVCHPLRYSSFVNNRIYLQTVIAFWTISATCSSIQCWLVSRLQFCGNNSINHVFCDYYPLLDLATSDTTHIRLISSLISAIMILVTIMSVFITYAFIIHTILQISSTSGRKKTFSTCSSHIIVFSMQYGLALGVYVLPAKAVTHQLTITFTFIHFFWTPLVNPLIYTFNNTEFRAECLKNIKRIESIF